MAACVMLAYCAVRSSGLGDTLVALFTWGVAVSAAGAMSNPAVQGMAQTYSTPETATVVASRTGVGVALGFVLGYIGGGRILDTFGIVPLLVSCALLQVAAIALVPPLNGAPRARKKTAGGLQELSAGLLYLFRTRALRNAAVAYVLCYTVFHTTTALLPSFAKFTLAVDAASFGVLRGSWSIGSAAGSLALTAFWGARRLSPAAKFLPVAALGAGFVIFAQSPSYRLVVVSIGAVGALHSLCRALLDGVLIEVCDADSMGRVRSNVNSLLSAVSLVVFASASFVRGEWLHAAFSAVGMTVSVCCLAIYLSVRRGERQAWRSAAVNAPP
jgi:MFS family permease